MVHVDTSTSWCKCSRTALRTKVPNTGACWPLGNIQAQGKAHFSNPFGGCHSHLMRVSFPPLGGDVSCVLRNSNAYQQSCDHSIGRWEVCWIKDGGNSHEVGRKEEGLGSNSGDTSRVRIGAGVRCKAELCWGQMQVAVRCKGTAGSDGDHTCVLWVSYWTSKVSASASCLFRAKCTRLLQSGVKAAVKRTGVRNSSR